MEEGLKVVLIPCSIRFDVVAPLRRTFSGKFMVVDLVGNLFIDDYSKSDKIGELQKRIEEGIENVLKSVNGENCEFYIMANGGALHTGLVVQEMMKRQIPFRFLVYEKKVGKYVIVN
jgi:hypothetical protein